MAGSVAAQATERVSIDALGAQGNGECYYTAISADGRWVAFRSGSSNLVSGDTNGLDDIFVRDRQAGTTERVSLDSFGVEGNGRSDFPAISSDGRFVAFMSAASNLVTGDSNSRLDIFVHDRQSGTTVRASVDSQGVQGNFDSEFPSISADGRYVVFQSAATNLIPGDFPGTDIFVHDLQLGTTERGAPECGSCSDASISSGGRFVAFQSGDSHFVSGDTNFTTDVFVHDRQGGTTERVSIDSLGVQGNQASNFPSISGDGRFVAFQSFASNLVGGDTNGAADIFVRDRQNGTTERVSVDASGAQANSSSWDPTLSLDGQHVAFHSFASDLVPGDTNGFADVFVHDRSLGSIERVSVDSFRIQSNGHSGYFDSPAITPGGHHLAFACEATNLVSGDTNGLWDIFVRDRCAPASSASFAGDGINADVITPVSAVVGSSWSAPLTLGHAHGVGGPLSLKIRSTTINGADFFSPIGGRRTEVLIAGPLLANAFGSHNGVSGDIAPQVVPDDLSLVGLTWAAQYAVVGGGFGDYSQAVFGVIGCP